MGKKYLDTKKGSLESSILGVWEEAAETKEGAMKRLATGGKEALKGYKKKPKKEEVKEENINEASDWLFEQIEGMTDEEFDNLIEEADELELEGILGAIGRGIKKVATAGSAKNRLARAKKKGQKISNKIALQKQTAKNKANKAKLKQIKKDNPGVIRKTAKKVGSAIKKKFQKNEYVNEASGDKEAYQKFFNGALKKFKVGSPAELKGDQKKKFYDYIDANWEGDNEKAEQVREFKVQSMRDALMKVWDIDEGKLPPALQKAIDKKKEKKEEDEEPVKKKNEKSDTGKPMAKIDMKPKDSKE